MTTKDVLIIIFCWFGVTQSQINLSRNGTTTQSSQYEGHDSSLAVTGGPTHEWNSRSCSATFDRNLYHAWWMLTFKTNTVFISNVVIYYRRITPDRLAGYYLYVTNNTISTSAKEPPQTGHLCYHHDDGKLPNIFQNVTCNAWGQRVIIYNQRKSGITYPSNYSKFAILELCDVQIHGCYKTWWGENCTRRCSEHCIDRHCHATTGLCIWGCRPDTCLARTCTSDALCSSGCQPGLAGQICDEYNIATNAAQIGLDTKTYNQRVNSINDGDKRSSSCVQLSGNDPSIQVDVGESYIIVAIKIYFKGSYISTNYTMAVTDTETGVSHIINSTDNNFSELSYPFLVHIHEMNPIVTGSYIKMHTLFSDDVLDVCEIEVTGCRPGMLGKLCDKSCPENCDGACDPRNGRCLFGCKEVYRGWNCSEACPSGYYGDKCGKECPLNCNGACHPATGRCVFGCKLSFVGHTCDEACLPGKYGSHCNNTCPENCDGQCERKSGACLINCEGSFCDKDQPSIIPAVVGVTISVLVVVIAISGACIYRRRNMPTQNNRRNDDQDNKIYTDTKGKNERYKPEDLYHELDFVSPIPQGVCQHEDPQNEQVITKQDMTLDSQQINNADSINGGICNEQLNTSVKERFNEQNTLKNSYVDMSGKGGFVLQQETC